MPYYPLPVPARVIEQVDDEERRWGPTGDKEIERRAKNRAKIQDLYAPINAIYDSGTPFFTKAAIGSLVQQIDESGVHRVQTGPSRCYRLRARSYSTSTPLSAQNPRHGLSYSRKR